MGMHRGWEPVLMYVIDNEVPPKRLVPNPLLKREVGNQAGCNSLNIRCMKKGGCRTRGSITAAVFLHAGAASYLTTTGGAVGMKGWRALFAVAFFADWDALLRFTAS